MTFRATNIVPVDAYELARQNAAGVRRFSQNLSTQLAAGGNSEEVLAVVDSLVSFKNNLNESVGVPGIVAYAQDQEDDPAYDVAAEFIALIALIDLAITEVVTTIPKDGGGFLLIQTINADGTRVPRDFTGAQLTGITTRLDNIVAGIS